jgi:hypothetical protein
MKHALFSILFFLSAFALQAKENVAAQKAVLLDSLAKNEKVLQNAKKDSVLKNLNSLKGEAKLEAYSALTTQAGHDKDFKIHLLNEWQKEAQRQQNTLSEGKARYRIMVEYYNAHDWENFSSRYADNMSYFKQNELWKEYFKDFELYAELLRLQGKGGIAIDEATKMFAFAKKINNYYGLGYVSKVLGHFYNLDNNVVQAEKYLRDAVYYFDKEGDLDAEFSVSNDLCWMLC